MSNKPTELKKDDYTIQIGYSPEAVEKKLMKFISKSGDEFIISSEEMISILMNQVNMDTLEPTFVNTERINVVEVSRQIKVVLTEDMEKGKEINLNYVHPYPLEHALLEEAYKIAKIEGNTAVVLTKEFLDSVRAKITPEMHNYAKKFYASFKNIELK